EYAIVNYINKNRGFGGHYKVEIGETEINKYGIPVVEVKNDNKQRETNVGSKVKINDNETGKNYFIKYEIRIMK
ncbi:23397_t:CDS:1, partial [Gigaspora rosea]